ncbi:meteorin-like protein isoform X2 [Neofelis nebulosa]|uniref:meteorin-like protein isoform X2 n=1 Tax=Neofelis nebulosa TaxID=61452 RepID=UPI00272D3812|nr:meteorin-like protein isoform X2 [Neofelis nebulosa]
MRGAARAAGGRAGQLWPRPPAPGPGPPPPLLLLLLGALLGGAGAQYSSDRCSWKGSGLTHEAHRKEVEQVYLRCSAGSVEWMYPTGALIVNVRPNTFPPSRRHLTLCIKPLRDSSGANIYLEKTGELQLLVRDGDRGPRQVHCFGFEQRGLFVEATPQQDISRRTTGFQYELTSRHAESDLRAQSAPCRPCPLPVQCCTHQTCHLSLAAVMTPADVLMHSVPFESCMCLPGCPSCQTSVRPSADLSQARA